MVVGKGTDAAVNADLTEKIEKQVLLPDDVVKDIAAQTLEREWESEGVELDDEERQRGEATVKGEAKDKTVKLAVLHHGSAAPIIQPKAIQRAFSIDLTDWLKNERGVDLELDLVGTMDVEEVNGNIRDTKTTGKTPGYEASSDSTQLIGYGLAKKVLDGRSPKQLVLDYLVYPKKNEPHYEPRKAKWSDGVIAGFLGRVENVARLIEAGSGSGLFVPARPEDWWCHKRWCGFHGTDLCAYWRRPVTIGAPKKKSKKENK